MNTFLELVSILKRTRGESGGITLELICVAIKESLAQEEIDYIIKRLTSSK